MRQSSITSHLKKFFAVSHEEIRKIVINFHDEMKRGLAGKESSLKMLCAYADRPRGNERGSYIALDFGGTNFRILEVVLDGKGGARIADAAKHVIPKAVIHGTGTQLFNFIAQSIKRFVTRPQALADTPRTLGFTFSFPMRQTGIANGVLINWTKGFSASGVVGKDVVRLLRASLAACGLKHIAVTALANDTVGTMAALAYSDAACDMGVIFGTGTNACYRETVPAITKLKRATLTARHMVINIEWGNFNRLPFIPYDEMLDRATNNPGKQRMEKMLSGMYLGEVARLVIADLIVEKHIFSACDGTFARGDFRTSHMSLVESDTSKDLGHIKEYLEGIGMLNSTLADRRLLKTVCALVSRRAARISAAAISAVITHMDPALASHRTVAVDGTMFEKYPRFRATIIATLKEIHGAKSRRIKLARAKDGSGLGVAIVAATAADSWHPSCEGRGKVSFTARPASRN